VGNDTAVVTIQVFPDRVRSGMTGRFNITLEAVDSDVVVGSPSQAEVKVPSSQP